MQRALLVLAIIMAGSLQALSFTPEPAVVSSSYCREYPASPRCARLRRQEHCPAGQHKNRDDECVDDEHHAPDRQEICPLGTELVGFVLRCLCRGFQTPAAQNSC